MPTNPATLRDAGLRRVGRGTRLLVAGSVAVAGLFSLVVAQLHPGSDAPHPGRSAAAPDGAGGVDGGGLSPAPAPGQTTQVPVARSAAS